MSLDWSREKVANWQTDEDVQRFTEAMVWGCLKVDLSRVTEQNVDEWLFRIEVLRQLDMSLTTYQGEPWYPNREVVLKFIGLRTNVSPMTRTKWMAKIKKHLEITAKRAVERQLS